ncbi:MAG: acetate--CoA ligase family protein [Rhodothalassiaceae bacterium]
MCSKAVDLAPFFAPLSVAILGASDRPTSSGGAVLHMMRKAGYGGRLSPVNPKGGEMHGLKVAKSLSDLAEPADLVIVAIRPDFIPDAVEEAARTGHRHVLILPGGFAEAGEEGAAREARLAALARRHGLMIAGPNCGGIIALGTARLAATFFRDLPPGGPLAFVSQSGALAEEMIAFAVRTATPLGTVVSVGNSMMLGIEDHLAHLGADPAVHALLLYLESARDLETLARTAAEVTRRKPVIALIPGQSPEGLAAARAHTGASAGSNAEIDALCRRSGIVRARSLRELQLAARLLGFFPRGFGKRALILSNSGGPGVLATDAARLAGLELPDLPDSFAAALRDALPAEASVRNPLDLLADAREERFGSTLAAALARSTAFDCILMIHVVPFMVDAGPVIDRLADLARSSPIPVLHAMMGTLEHRERWFSQMEEAGVPMFDNVEDMAAAAGLLAAAASCLSGGEPQ